MSRLVTKATAALLFLCALLAIGRPVYGQELEVSGRVTSEDGEALPGVNIVVKGTTIGTATDVNGTYELSVPSLQDTLVFSFIGFVPQEAPINGRSTIDVTLSMDTEQLEEIVVVGYGTLGRESVTGAITKVSAEELANVPVASAAEALQGRVSGVMIAADEPGRAPHIRIRGLTTPNNNAPLIVVDGVPVSNLLAVDASSIASIEVLKDASAAAIYGSRAAGGVILVTTKDGSSAAEGIQTYFSSYVGVQQPWKKLDLLNTQQYIAFAKAISENGGDEVPPRIGQLGQDAPNIDYQDEVFRTAPLMNYDLAFSGGGQTAQYRVGLGYLSQEGTIVNSGFDRYSASVNTDFQIGRFRFGESLNMSYMHRANVRVAGGRSVLQHTTKYPPYLLVYDDTGFNGPDLADGNDAENPIRVQELGDNEYRETRLIGNLYGEMRIIEGLNLRTVLGMETNFSTDYIFVPSFSDGEYHGQDYATLEEARTRYFAPVSTTTLNYEQAFREQHTVSVLAGFEAQTFDTRVAGASGRNTLTDEIQVLGGITSDIAIGSEFRDVLLSYFTRLNYNYADRYLLQASLRRDGYSRFGPDSRYGIFPSVSAGWNLAEEAFMDETMFDMFKLRASYGEVGNNNALGRYEYQPTVSTNYFYVFNGELVPAATIPGLANEALKWETTTMMNVGLDLALLNNALTFSAEYYNNASEDLLLTVPLPGSFGIDFDPRFNTGEVTTSGFEFTLGYLGGTGDVQWDVSAHFATASNEVTSLGRGAPLNGATWQGSTITRVEQGKPLYFFYGHVVDRLFQESDFTNGALNEELPDQPNVAPGDIKFRDLNDDGVVNAADRTNIGHPMPDYTYGLNASLNWKNFDASIFFQGAGGHQIYQAYAYWTEGMSRVFNATTEVLRRWTAQNTDTDLPRGITGDPALNARPSDRWVDDGDYLRLKLLTIGYTVPTRFAGLQRLRIYVQSRNLLTFTGYDGYDPEIGVFSNDPGQATSDFGVDYGQYPQPRSFLFGLQLTF